MTPQPISAQAKRSFFSHGSVASPLHVGEITLIRARNPPMKAPIRGENCPTCKTNALSPMWKTTMSSIRAPIQTTDLTTTRGDEFIHCLLRLCEGRPQGLSH